MTKATSLGDRGDRDRHRKEVVDQDRGPGHHPGPAAKDVSHEAVVTEGVRPGVKVRAIRQRKQQHDAHDTKRHERNRSLLAAASQRVHHRIGRIGHR
ncbi:hypothetical protein GCM10025876_01220 [Demequina litorisediminis]|uniref:Uncharacterized protein n=1 Tax=Demequina litorisediminis TaxID=1849022 RepID=A0ABQ6IAZ6_9MICO|nr:hypothetical protein GCM10025876_01220 [Demequina litorisediminis]